MPDQPASRMSLDSALTALARRRAEQVVVSTMTALAPWRERAGTDRDLVCVGFMGGASSLGLGIALARPDVPVWVIDGDGSLAMQLGSLITIAHAAPRRFLHVVMHNGVYDTSGCARAVRFDNVESFDAALEELLEVDGPVLVELMTEPTGAGYIVAPPPETKPTPALARTWPVVAKALASAGN